MKEIPDSLYEVIIIGGGPAGLTAGLYAARAKLKALLFEGCTVSAQVALTEKIENYPGFPEGVGGYEFLDRLKAQVKRFGLEVLSEDARALEPVSLDGSRGWRVSAGGRSYDSLSVIVATGAKPKRVGVPGEEKLCGKGVSYCAVCDGPLYQGKDVVVVGGGDAAVEEALFLTRFAKKVTLVHRRDALRAAKVLQDEAQSSGKIEFVWNSVITRIAGEKAVSAVGVKNVVSGEEKELPCAGVFIYIGFTPNTDFLKGAMPLNENGYVITDEDMKASRDGIFACGDCRQKRLRQVITACGDGAVAAVSARAYVEGLKIS